MDKIPLSDLLIELRGELDKAQREGEGKQMRFSVQEIDLEIQVTATASGEVGGGIKFWVISSDAKGKLEEGVVQKLHLKLSPVIVDTQGKPTGPVFLSNTRK